MADATPTPTTDTADTPATDAPALRLVRDKPLDEVGPFRFERRQRDRWSASGRVTVVNYGDISDRQRASNKRIGSLQLLDLSSNGVGAWSQEPVEVGSRIAVFFPERGADGGFDRYGTVRRCQPDGNGGYTVGVELEMHVQHAA